MVVSAIVGAAAVAGVAWGNLSAGRGESRCVESLKAKLLARLQPDDASSRPGKGEEKKEAVAVASHELEAMGFSMEEARIYADEMQVKAQARKPGAVLADLQRGNARFWMNAATRPEASAFERRTLIAKQFPSVAILGCSDSRVPTEIVFDQGLGDIFVVRVAGNLLDTATSASLQFAVNHLKVKVLMVMGHELCGAVKAAQLPNDQLEQEETQLGELLKGIKGGLDQQRLTELGDFRALDREAVTTNVKAQVERLTQDPGLMMKIRSGQLLIVGAFYEISSGIVDFFHEVSEDDAASPQRAPSFGVQSIYTPNK